VDVDFHVDPGLTIVRVAFSVRRPEEVLSFVLVKVAFVVMTLAEVLKVVLVIVFHTDDTLDDVDSVVVAGEDKVTVERLGDGVPTDVERLTMPL